MKLGINGLGRIGKLSLWHHVSRQFFSEIVVNLGRNVGAGIVVGGTPAAYGQFIAQERAKWAPVIKAANITLD